MILLLLSTCSARPMRRPVHRASPTLTCLAHSDIDFVPVEPIAQLPNGEPPLDRFDFMRSQGRPCRIDRNRLPWGIYTAPAQQHLVGSALQLWNQFGAQLGWGPFFVLVFQPDPADLWVRWGDARLPRDKAAATWWSSAGSGFRTLGVSVEFNPSVAAGNQIQALAHELGHVLGLGESYQVGDLMYYKLSSRRLRPNQVRLTDRDRTALQWLYQIPSPGSIRGRRD